MYPFRSQVARRSVILLSWISREIGRKSGELDLSTEWMIACFQEHKAEARQEREYMMIRRRIYRQGETDHPGRRTPAGMPAVRLRIQWIVSDFLGDGTTTSWVGVRWVHDRKLVRRGSKDHRVVGDCSKLSSQLSSNFSVLYFNAGGGDRFAISCFRPVIRCITYQELLETIDWPSEEYQRPGLARKQERKNP